MASSSRLHIIPPISRQRTCQTCFRLIPRPQSTSQQSQARRPFTSTPLRSVKRPQKPFEAPVAHIDAYGRRISPSFAAYQDARAAKLELERHTFLSSLSESKAKSAVEKYGSRTFGLRRNSVSGRMETAAVAGEEEDEGRYADRANFRDGREGSAEMSPRVWGGRGRGGGSGGGGGRQGFGLRKPGEVESWRETVGAHRKGKKQFQSSQERYLEQARLLNPDGVPEPKKKGKDARARGPTPSVVEGGSGSGEADAIAGRTASQGWYGNGRPSNMEERAFEGGYQDSWSGYEPPDLEREWSDEQDRYRNRYEERRTRVPAQAQSQAVRFGPWANNNSASSDLPSSSSSSPSSYSAGAYEDRGRATGPPRRKSFGLASTPRERPLSHDEPLPPSSQSTTANAVDPSNRPGPPVFSPISSAGIQTQQAEQSQSPRPPSDRWEPTKKLTYSAMAGLRALHTLDPEKFTRPVLSKRFGISVEAVSRILKSKFRTDGGDLTQSLDLRGDIGGETMELGEESGLTPAPGPAPVPGRLGGLVGERTRTSGEGGGMGKKSLRGTKWDRDPGSAEGVSPVPAILRAYERR